MCLHSLGFFSLPSQYFRSMTPKTWWVPACPAMCTRPQVAGPTLHRSGVELESLQVYMWEVMVLLWRPLCRTHSPKPSQHRHPAVSHRWTVLFHSQVRTEPVVPEACSHQFLCGTQQRVTDDRVSEKVEIQEVLQCLVINNNNSRREFQSLNIRDSAFVQKHQLYKFET